ncbi:MAG: hypothetical protein JXA36_05125 [Coriobacteriia bacterium]|nr:hypothetical protein [Coriobacteriia bacterium]
MACWSLRGCDDEMREGCPHAIDPEEKCPLSCQYAKCDRSTYRATTDPALIFDLSIDRSAAAREVCTGCVFFLTNGPRL